MSSPTSDRPIYKYKPRHRMPRYSYEHEWRDGFQWGSAPERLDKYTWHPHKSVFDSAELVEVINPTTEENTVNEDTTADPTTFGVDDTHEVDQDDLNSDWSGWITPSEPELTPPVARASFGDQVVEVIITALEDFGGDTFTGAQREFLGYALKGRLAQAGFELDV